MKYPLDLSRFDQFNAPVCGETAPAGSVLLYGSSFFTNWGRERAHDQLLAASNGALNVVNHGFGGATVDDLLYFYPDLVRPCRPALMVWRGGVNDCTCHFPVYDAWQNSMRVFEWARKDIPGVKIAILSVFDYPSGAGADRRAYYREYNELAQEYARDNDQVVYLDINEFFYQSPADVGTFENFREIFVQDGLHMNDRGYEEFAAYIAPRLTDILRDAQA